MAINATINYRRGLVEHYGRMVSAYELMSEKAKLELKEWEGRLSLLWRGG